MRPFSLAAAVLIATVGRAQPGALDLGFNPGQGTFIVETSSLQEDGKIIIGGHFLQYDGAPRNYIARINVDGSLDTTFQPSIGPNSSVLDAVVQPDGKILACGAFTAYDGEARGGLVLINPDGSIVEDFSPSGIPNGQLIRRIVMLPGGKIVIGGEFMSFNGVPVGKITRLNPNGSVDPTFIAGGIPSLNGQVFSMASGPDGSLYVGGNFTQFSGRARGGIVRLYSNGEVDSTVFIHDSGFYHSNGVVGFIYSIAVQPDGKVLVGGSFDRYDDTPCSGLVRLNANGTLDETFEPAAGGDWGYAVNVLSLQPDGRVVVGGSFTSYHGTPMNILARLEANGSLDASFVTGTGPNNRVWSVTLRPDGKIFIGGWFDTYNEVSRPAVAQVHGTPAPPGIALAIRALLEGPYDSGSGLMNDNLRNQGLPPLDEPYTSIGFSHVGGGGETTAPSVWETTGADALVDWVVVELRDGDDPADVLATRSAMLQRDGDIVATDGISPVVFAFPAGNYHVSVRHRNHLGAMTANQVPLSATTTSIDFSNGNQPGWGSNALKNIGGVRLLWAGDTNFDGQVKYVGDGNDRDAILVAIGGSVPTNMVSGTYSRLDVNLDGAIKYVGDENDRDLQLQTIGGSVPTAVRLQQLP